jgi:hypothetical protein
VNEPPQDNRTILMLGRAAIFLALLAVFCISACRSAYVETTLENDGSAPLRLIEVDYPSASFGMQSLDAHGTFHYRFKVQGSGPITITWTDAGGKSHTAAGPVLKEGQQGTLRITINPSVNASWDQSLSAGK